MQGYAQRSNQQPPPRYQESPPPYPTEQERHCNGHQRVVNNWSAPQAVCSDAFAPALQQIDGRYYANQTLRQQPPTRPQLHYNPSNVVDNAEGQATDNPYGNNIFYGQLNTQACLYVASHQNNRNTETLISHSSSIKHHAYGTCQQLQPGPDHIYPQQLPGQQQTALTPGHTIHYNPTARNRTIMQRIISNQAQCRTAVGYTSPNSVTLPPGGPQINISPPSNSVQQSRPELESNPNVSSAQFQNNQSSAEHPHADAYVQMCNVTQNAQNQTAPRNEAQLDPTSRDFNLNYYIKSKISEILHSQKEKDLKNKSTTNQNQNPLLRELLSEPVLQSAAEPPHKRKNVGQTLTFYRKKSPSKNISGLQSPLPGTRQMALVEQNSIGNGHDGQRQNDIQYVTDPAECLEAVFAIQKSSQQVHKAVAIVPPISLLASNSKKKDDAYMKTDDSPPLKIAAAWSLAKESYSQNPITTEKNDKLLSEDSSPVSEQDDRMSPESKTKNTADSCTAENSDLFSVNPTAGCENYCDSRDPSFELSDVPVVAYTLEYLRNLVKSLEMKESSAERLEKPEGVCNQIFDLYWNRDVGYLKRHFKELREMRSYFDMESVKDDKSVVFESITQDFKKVAHCEIVTDELCSSFEEYVSSWLNVDGQPADIDKVLSEPLSDYITVSKEASGNAFVPADNLGANFLKDPEVTPLNVNEGVKPDSVSIFTPTAGSGRTDTKNKKHSDAENSEVKPLCSVSNEQETVESQGDNMQNHKHLNTKPPTDFSPSEDTSSEQRDDSTNKENMCQEHIRDNLTIGQKESVPHIGQQLDLDSKTLLHDHLPVSALLPACSIDKALQLVGAVSDAVKDIEESSTTKPRSKFIGTWQVEDISDDSMDSMEIASKNVDTLQENIFQDENSDKMQISTNTTGTLPVENTSEDENSDSMEVVTESTDICIEEDISNDENSSDDSLLMDVTVLSSEEALTFFQQLEKESTQSSVEHPKLMASSPSQTNREYNKAKICSCCGINDILTSYSFDVTDSDRELFCPPCWDMAPSLDFEMDPCSPKSNETDVLGSDGESEKLEDNCSPSPVMEIREPFIASTDVHVAEEELYEKTKDDTVVNSVAEQKPPEIKHPVDQEILEIQPDKLKEEDSEKHKLHKHDTDSLGDDAASGKMQDNCGLPSLEMEVLETVIASNAANSAEELTEKTKDMVVNSVPEQKVSEIQSNVEQELAKIRPDKTNDEKMKIKSKKNKPPSKSAFLQHKFKPSRARFISDDSVLFAPDIVIKMSRPQKKKHKAVSAVNRPGGKIQNCNNGNKPLDERPDLRSHSVTDKTSQNHKEKVIEKQSSYSTQFMNKTLHRSNMTPPEVHSDNLTEKKITTKKVRFALYGSKNEHQCAAIKRKFSPPATLTVTNVCKDLSKNTSQSFPERHRFSAPATLSSFSDYSDVISAKQKVHDQWSSTFIPTAKITPPPKSPRKGEPMKKKPLKPHELLKSNMPALKNQMIQRSILLYSKEISKSIQKH